MGAGERRLVVTVVLVLLGWQWVLVGWLGSGAPYWDQWDAEAMQLYLPWYQGHLGWRDLLAPFLEHRLVCTRVLDLLLLEINGGVWNCQLQMAVNSVLHVLALALLLRGLLDGVQAERRKWLVLLAAVLFGVPFGVENLLWGFQSQFYFLLLFSLLFISGLAVQVPLSAGWWASVGCGLLAPLSLASGSVTLVSGVLLISLRWWAEGKRGWAPPGVALLLAGAAAWFYLTMPVTSYGLMFKAHSFGQLFDGLNQAISWPFVPWSGLLIWLPLVAQMWRWWRSGLRLRRCDWLLLGVAIWLLGQLLALAYGRALNLAPSRYKDIFLLGPLINGACLLGNFQPLNWRVLSGNRLHLIWLLIVALGVAVELPNVFNLADQRAVMGAAQEIKLRSWLANDQSVRLRGSPLFDLPYPTAPRLQRILAQPEVQRFLPARLMPANTSREPWLVRKFVDHLMIFGLVVMTFGFVVAWRRPGRTITV